MATEYNANEITEALRNYLGDEEVFVVTIQQVNRWLDRGDGIAMYENHDLGHPDVGHRKFTSYGSPQAQLEVPVPPDILPDGIGGTINWRYQLVSTYKGEALSADAT